MAEETPVGRGWGDLVSEIRNLKGQVQQLKDADRFAREAVAGALLDIEEELRTLVTTLMGAALSLGRSALDAAPKPDKGPAMLDEHEGVLAYLKTQKARRPSQIAKAIGATNADVVAALIAGEGRCFERMQHGWWRAKP
jgi:hypothetical protein